MRVQRSFLGSRPKAVVVVIVVLVACSIPTTHFRPDGDTRAMAAIAGTWGAAAAGASRLTLSLCEDRARSDAYSAHDDKCQVAHVVRGEGRGVAEDVDTGGGCGGGCPFSTVAYVSGSVRGGPFAAATAVSGVVYVGAGDSAYDFPYTVELACVDASHPCRVFGTLEENGVLDAQVDLGSSPYVSFDGLVKSASSTCASGT